MLGPNSELISSMAYQRRGSRVKRFIDDPLRHNQTTPATVPSAGPLPQTSLAGRPAYRPRPSRARKSARPDEPGRNGYFTMVRLFSRYTAPSFFTVSGSARSEAL